MPARKQFAKPVAATARLSALLEASRGQTVSDDTLREQQVSFAFGNALDNESITKDTVRNTAKRVSIRS